jgi:quinolinate synthase
MADMATFDQVEECWDVLVAAGVADDVVPVSYMNSSAAIKAFTGRHGGTICTSSNAKRALTWAFEQDGPGREPEGAVPAGPAPGPQHRGPRDGAVARGLRRLRPAQAGGGLTVEQLRRPR